MTYKKTILVTGGAGFIGSNFLNIWVKKYPDYFFVNIDSLTYASDMSNVLVEKMENYNFQKMDIRDFNSLDLLFKEFNFTDIINFAAESHVDVSIENPKIFLETNIVGTYNLLELARKYNIKRFYQISTDEVYGSLAIDDKPFSTDSILNPSSPYSASKASADMLVSAYHKTYGLDTVISRSTNNYGPNQDNSKFIPKFIENLIKGEKVPLYSNGQHVRDWIYVLDHVEAIDLVFHRGISGGVYNIGSNQEFTNREVVNKLLELSGRDESYIDNVPDRLGHDFRYALDTKEMFEEFGWQARTSFIEGIQKTFDFYKNRVR